MANSGLPLIPPLDPVVSDSTTGTSSELTGLRQNLDRLRARPSETSPFRVEGSRHAEGEPARPSARTNLLLHIDDFSTPARSTPRPNASSLPALPALPTLSSLVSSTHAGNYRSRPIVSLQPRFSLSRPCSPRGVDSINIMGL